MAVVRTKFHVETVGQLFALIQTSAKFLYFGACADIMGSPHLSGRHFGFAVQIYMGICSRS